MQAHETSQGTTPPAGRAPNTATAPAAAQGRRRAEIAALAPEQRAQIDAAMARVREAWATLEPRMASALDEFRRAAGRLADAVCAAGVRDWGYPAAIDDLCDVLFPRPERTSDADREAATWRLADGLARGWRVHDPAARRALRALPPGDARAQAKRDAAVRGLLLALADGDRPQRVRLGARWVVDDAGRPQLIAPSELTLWAYLQWLRGAAIRAAEAVLADRPWPAEGDARGAPEYVPLEEAVLAREVTDGPTFADLVLDRLEAEAVGRLLSERAARDDVDRRIARALEDGEPLTEVAGELGISAAAAWKRSERLLRRARALLPPPG